MKRESQRAETNPLFHAFEQLCIMASPRSVCLLAMVLVVSGQSGCQSPELSPEIFPDAGTPPPGVMGQTVVYRFPTGRTYQAEYHCEGIRFVLLHPELSPPPSKTMPFSARSIRPGLDLVVWEDPEFHTTFVVDFERRMLHASALRDGSSAFLGQAEIVEIRPTKSGAGEVIECPPR